jgi:hypothetical protein
VLGFTPTLGQSGVATITLTFYPLAQIPKTPWIYAEIFGPNLDAKPFYISPLGVMHCKNNNNDMLINIVSLHIVKIHQGTCRYGLKEV